MTIEKSTAFERAYNKLAPILRSRVERCIRKLVSTPKLSGLNVEKVRGASSDVRSCRVTRGLRLIYKVLDPQILQLLYVGDHDIAYREAIWYWLAPAGQAEIPAEELGSFKMFSVSDDYLNQLNLDDLKAVLAETDVSAGSGYQLGDLAGIIQHLIAVYLNGGTDGKAPSNAGDQIDAPINVIPSEVGGPCQSILIAFCFDGDSFNDRFREIAYHAGIHCPETKLVIIITSDWNAKHWKKNHEKAFADLKAITIIYLAGPGRLTRIC
jgi:mRNA-degrading endonuclease YafQ of YafQ-DinJ toxin-antitoxin module